MFFAKWVSSPVRNIYIYMNFRFNISLKYLSMNPSKEEALKELLSNVIEAMTECMEQEKVHYRQRDINKCARIVKNFLESIKIIESKTEGLLEIQKTVEALNDLNKSSKQDLIGIMEREDLCEIINTASFLKGISNPKEDLTKSWRKW